MKIFPNIEHLIDIEGGYTNDPLDSGGETNFGVTLAVARAFGYMGAMKDMTRNQAKELFLARYWIQPGFDKVSEISGLISLELFDTGVNMGTGVATKFLQRALNVLNLNGTMYPDMVIDGGLGKMTQAALAIYLANRKGEGLRVLMGMLNGQQCVRYIELAEARPKDERYVFGWQSNRVVMA